MRRWLVLGAVLLSGCGTFGGNAVAPIGVPLSDEQFCQRQANDDPAVKLLIMKGLGNQNFALSSQQQLAEAKQDATNSCLRSRGVIPKGGVERQKT